VIGNILGNRYRILREIGSGGMAKVYLAEDINDGQLEAIKVLHPHFSEDVSYLQRFTREAKLASMLDNPHIVKLLDYGSSRGIHYLVMEYVEGKELREIIAERGPLLWEEAMGLIDQICEALEVAHNNLVVHRDIKPQNVMLTEDGLLKVLDFGIARARMLPSLTQSGFVGSPYYISPEQAMGEEVDIRSDIYSTGIVLYEILSGRVPFDAKSPWSIISKHIISEPPEIDLEDRPVPASVKTFFNRMVAKRPDDRFQNPTVARQAIAAILAGQDIPADLGAPPPADVDKIAMADGIYRRAEKAIKQTEWQKAVNLLNQVINLNPNHSNATQKLTQAGVQARLTALYTAAMRAMEGSRWQEAIDELTEVIEIDPNYKDSAKLLVQAKGATNKRSEDLQLSQLYEQAMAAFEANNYDQAEELFAKVKKMSPTYRRADALWAESRRRKRKRGGFDRLSKTVKSEEKKSTIPLKWIGVTAAVIIGIVALVFFISSKNQVSPNNDPSLETLYAQAQTAIERDDIVEGTNLLNQILTQDPNYKDAVQLKQSLSKNDILEQQLEQARAALNAEEWTKAIEILENLADDTSNTATEAETIRPTLCDAYLSRGKDRLSRVTNPKDRATIQSALSDFLAGQQRCEDHNNLAAQTTRASDYLLALQDDTTADKRISILKSIILAEADYAGGQAAQNLYLAYLSRGDQRQQQRNAAGALEDYNAALALNVADLSAAQEKQAMVLQNLNASPTPPPTSTKEPIATLTTEAIVTTAPPPDAATPTPQYIYLAPKLLSPEPYATYAGEFSEITLNWESVGALAENEYYDVTTRYFVGEEPRYWGSGLIKETSWRVPTQAGYGQAGKDEIAWWITVRAAIDGTDQSQAISPPSEERVLIWRP